MTSIRSEVDDSSLQVGWIGHSSHWDSVEPFISENRVGVEDDYWSVHLKQYKTKGRTLGQVGEDVSGRDTVDSDLVVCPFDSK